MQRLEEYAQLTEELREMPERLEGTWNRARQRDRRRKWMIRPAVSAAAVFVCFVLLVNFCVPVAYACSRIPGLKELAAAVTFSRSLTDAVEHEYVQPVGLELTDGEVTLWVDYLIVDQKQVNVFFRLDSGQFEHMAVTPDVLDEDGSYLEGCGYGCNDFDVENGALQSLTVDFMDEDVPGKLRLRLEIEELKALQAEAEMNIDSQPPEQLQGQNTVAVFDFTLEFDPAFTATGRTVPLNQVVELDGQRIRFTELEIYPTHLRVNVEEGGENTAWLKQLDFYLETDWGMKFEPVANGITATGEENSPMMVSYRADSTYFYEADHLNIVVTGAKWLDKDMDQIRLDLAEGSAEVMPEGTMIDSVRREAEDWIITVKAQERGEGKQYQIFNADYYDGAGAEYWRDSWAVSIRNQEGEEEEGWFYEIFRLEQYPYEEVWLTPVYSREWTAEQEITIKGW